MEKEYDLYERLAGVIFDLPLEEITALHRTNTKELVLGWAYSMRTPKDEIQKRYDEAVAEMERIRKEGVQK